MSSSTQYWNLLMPMCVLCMVHHTQFSAISFCHSLCMVAPSWTTQCLLQLIDIVWKSYCLEILQYCMIWGFQFSSWFWFRKLQLQLKCFSDFGDFKLSIGNIFQFLPKNIQIPLKHEKSILLFRLKTTIEEAGVLLLIHTLYNAI